MQSHRNQDQFVKMIIKTSDDFSVAGTKLEGSVFVNSLLDRNYNQLILKLACFQQLINHSVPVCSLFRSPKKSLKYENIAKQSENGSDCFQPSQKIIETFEDKFILESYKDYLPKGSYVYKFCLHLPANLPASSIIHTSIISAKIHYILTATLANSKGQTFFHHSSLPITIVQSDKPPKITETILSDASICSFFNFQQSRTVVYLNMKNRTLSPNFSFNLLGKIDTRDSSSDIKGVNIILSRKIIATQNKRIKQLENKQWKLWKGFYKLPKGVLVPFDLTLLVPSDANIPSTIGSMMGVVYKICVEVLFTGIQNSKRIENDVVIHCEKGVLSKKEAKKIKGKILKVKEYRPSQIITHAQEKLLQNTQNQL